MTKHNKVRWFVGLMAAGAAVVTLSVAQTWAQDQAQPKQPKQWQGRGMGGGMMGRGMMHRGRMGMMGFGLGQLTLSDQQKTQIKEIMQGHQSEAQGFAQRMRTARTALAQSVMNGADEATIRQKSTDVAKVEADMAVARAAIHKQVMAVLTSDQQAKAKELQDQMLQRMAQVGPRGQKGGQF